MSSSPLLPYLYPSSDGKRMILYRKRGISLYSSSGVGMTFSKGGRFKWDFIEMVLLPLQPPFSYALAYLIACINSNYHCIT